MRGREGDGPFLQFLIGLLIRRRILQQDPHRGFTASDDRVGLLGLRQGESVRDQRLHVEPSVGQHVQHRLEVALLRPAHETDRIVLALFLVVRVVTAGAVRGRHLEGEFLLEEVVARQLQPGHADQHDAPTLAAHQRGLVHRLAAARGCRDQHRIDTTTAGESFGRLHRVFASREIDHLGTERACQGELGRVQIDPQHPTTVGPQQLHRDLADQAKPGNHDSLAQRRPNQADTLQSDRTDHREGRRLVAHAIGYPGAQVDRHADDLGVLAVGGDAIADSEALDTAPDFQHPAHVAVTQRQRLFELVAHRVECRHQPIGLHLVQHHAYLVRLLAGLFDGVGLAKIHQHAFSTGRDERSRGADQQLALTGTGAWHFGHLGSTGFQVLKNLFHTYFLASINIKRPALGKNRRMNQRGQMRLAIESMMPACRWPASDSSRSPWVRMVRIVTSEKALNNCLASTTVYALVPGLSR